MIFGFVIKMIINDPISQSRHFLFKYYLDDTEFAVYEYTGENSGEIKVVYITIVLLIIL